MNIEQFLEGAVGKPYPRLGAFTLHGSSIVDGQEQNPVKHSELEYKPFEVVTGAIECIVQDIMLNQGCNIPDDYLNGNVKKSERIKLDFSNPPFFFESVKTSINRLVNILNLRGLDSFVSSTDGFYNEGCYEYDTSIRKFGIDISITYYIEYELDAEDNLIEAYLNIRVHDVWYRKSSMNKEQALMRLLVIQQELSKILLTLCTEN